MYLEKLAIFVLSCDAYSDLWNDFFNLRDKYWSDCPYRWHLVTESLDYNRDGVEVIKCGSELNWAGRLRFAVNSVKAQYYGIFLEDFFITEKIDNEIISNLIDVMDKYCVTFLNTSDVFYNILGMKEKSYVAAHLIMIPKDRLYGVSTEAAIWERDYLLKKLGTGDYSAWQFEIDRVNEAKSSEGLGGFNLCDDRMPFHVSIEPVVIQGKIYPAARKFFKKQGYEFLTMRENMSCKQVFFYNLKMRMANIKYGKKAIKWLATKFLGVKFFT